MGNEVLWNDGWLFSLSDDAEYVNPGYDDKGWEAIELPHDWSIEREVSKDNLTGGGGGYVVAGVGTYRKHFVMEELPPDKQTGFLFDGIYMNSTIYLNGVKIGGHAYGYSSFYVDATDAIKVGENIICVRVDNSHQPNSRWYTGSGIYRNVYMVKKAKVHFALWGVRCHTNGIFPMQSEASLQIDAFVENQTGEAVYAKVVHRLLDAAGEEVSVSSAVVCAEPGESSKCSGRPAIKNPILWTDENPYLYTLESTLVIDDMVWDVVASKIGIRTATFDADRGFLLNGESVKIKGMCVHHDCGMVGAANYKEIWRRRLLALKDMGCNGIRCSHNIPSVEFLDLCDELGFLVMDEAFDEWMLGKNKNDNYYSQNCSYGSSQFFAKCAREDMLTMLHRDYNHPSVILWSIGNEIPEQSSHEGIQILKFLRDICHEEDCSRMVTSACDNIQSVPNYMTLREFEEELDVVGYNYVGRWRNRAETFYEEDRMLYPKRRMIGSENPSLGGMRGDEFSEFYIKALLSNEALWRYINAHDFVAGDYLWTGIDYLGETRWPSRGAAFGPIDSAGFPKDSYYYFRSIWNQKDFTLHLAPHWNYPGEEGEFKQILCFTNCDQVELFINGRKVGTKGCSPLRFGAVKAWNDFPKNHDTTGDLHLSWDVPYEPGELKAIGYKNGEMVAQTILETPGAASELRVKLAGDEPKVGGLIQLEIEAVDCKGNLVDNADYQISCEIDGDAKLIGMDSGDLKNLEIYSNAARRMYAGKLFAIIKPEKEGALRVSFKTTGNITIEGGINLNLIAR